MTNIFYINGSSLPSDWTPRNCGCNRRSKVIVSTCTTDTENSKKLILDLSKRLGMSRENIVVTNGMNTITFLHYYDKNITILPIEMVNIYRKAGFKDLLTD